MGPLYLGKMGTFVNFRYINNLALVRGNRAHLIFEVFKMYSPTTFNFYNQLDVAIPLMVLKLGDII